MARRGRYTSSVVLAVLVLVASGAAFWSLHRVPDSVREERHDKLLPALRRDRIARIEFVSGNEHWTIFKERGHWFVSAGGHRFDADEPEVERILTEAEFAAPSRHLGALDHAARERFGLTTPRVRVTLDEEQGNIHSTFDVGGLVADEDSVYVETENAGFVVPKSLADAYVRRPSELRDRTLSQIEPARLARLEIDPGTGVRVLEQNDGIWRLTTPPLGRASRTRVESILHDLRDFRATRFLSDDTSPASLARYGLDHPSTVLRVVRAGNLPVIEWNFGGPCETYTDELTVMRVGGDTVACVGRAVADNLRQDPNALRDEKLVWAHGDEIERVHIHSPSADFSLVRDHDHWRLDGATGDVDADAVDNWFNALSAMNVESRLDAASAAAHGIAPTGRWFEIARTGVPGTERLEVGEPDADHMYARRAGETDVLAIDPSSADNLRIDAARFRSHHVIRDVADELTALVTDAPDFHDEATKTEGAWHLGAPVSAEADPSVMRAVSQRLATLDADRWVSADLRPEQGLTPPHVRITARFEGAGPEPEPLADGGAPRDAGRPHMREYTLLLGAPARGGGVYASLVARGGAFVLPQAAWDELVQAHVERDIATIDPAAVERVEITRATGPALEIRRDGEVWRTAAGAPVDRTRANALLQHFAAAHALRAVGYGAAPANAHIGPLSIAFTLGAHADAGGAQTVRIVFGDAVEGSEGGTYARRNGLDATFVLPREIADSVRDFVP